MKKLGAAFLALACSLSLSFCQKPKTASTLTSPSSIAQGLCGKVVWKEGNLMPGPGQKPSQGKAVRREMAIYELTNTNQVQSEGPFYRNIQTKLIQKIRSDADGKFCVELPAGQYSLFSVEEEKGLYANSFDGDNNIFSIKIEKGKVEDITFTIDYKAAY